MELCVYVSNNLMLVEVIGKKEGVRCIKISKFGVRHPNEHRPPNLVYHQINKAGKSVP